MLGLFKSKKDKAGPVSGTAGILAEEAEKLTNEPLNLSIHVMPRRFLEAAATARQSKNAGLLILVLGGLLLLVLGGGGYYYIFLRKPPAPKPVVVTPVVEETASTTVEELARQAEAEKQTKLEAAKKSYIDFKNSLANTTTLTDYDQLVTGQADGDILAAWQAAKDKTEKLTEEEKTELLALLKSCQPGIADMAGILTGDLSDNGQATFVATSTTYNIQVALNLFGTGWKIAKEDGFTCLDKENASTTLAEWMEKHQTATLPENEELKTGIDADSDGLLDSEEALLGTKVGVKDSDGDGYEDLSELKNSYNPAGTGKLTDNIAIKIYANSAFKYSVLVPSAWTEEKTGDDSLIWRSADNHFLQILVQPNANKTDIETWYKAQFDSDTIPTDSIYEKKDKNGAAIWKGIKSRNGLSIYLTDPGQEYIYVLSYSPGEAKSLEYPNIYQLMIDSFEFTK